MTKSESFISVKSLAETFVLMPDGQIFWRERPVHHFTASAKRSAEHICANWNARYAGMPAIACITPFGHKTGRINNRLVYAHRIVWAMHTGAWPNGEIDHINGKPDDNRIENLRDVCHRQNLKNQSLRKNNTSGDMGVRFYRPRKAWAASIGVNGKSIHLGYFAEKEQAIAARLAANARHEYHQNHGRK